MNAFREHAASLIEEHAATIVVGSEVEFIYGWLPARKVRGVVVTRAPHADPVVFVHELGTTLSRSAMSLTLVASETSEAEAAMELAERAAEWERDEAALDMLAQMSVEDCNDDARREGGL
jgi:hypothetical protein